MIVSKGSALDFAPQALAETVPFLSNGYFYPEQGLTLSNQFAVYAAIYKKQPSVATLVDKIANSAARLTVKVWDTTDKSGRTQDTSSAFSKLMAKPTTEMSPMSFWRWTFSTYEIYGEAFWYKQRANRDANGNQYGPVVNLLPMHPSRVAVHRNADGTVEYVFTLGVASAGILIAPASDVVAFLRYNPDNLMRGLSRLEPLNSTILNEDAARRANASWWLRGARPSVVLTHPGELSQDAMDRVKAKFDAKQAGADNMGGSAVLQEGMTAQVVQLSLEEMQYIESRKMNLQEACMVYDVPPPVVHILDHATFSNITEQMRSMYRDTMSPRLEDVESVIDFSLLPEFGLQSIRETEFDMTEVLRGDFETRADKAVTLRQSGIFTGNQSLELVGLPKSDDPEMDKIYANAALVPLGTPAQRVSITEAATPDPTLMGEASSTASDAADAAAQAASAKPDDSTSDGAKALWRDVMGKAGRVKASKAAIRDTLKAEHVKQLTKFFAAQKAATGSSFDPSQWDGDLSSLLHTLSAATAEAIGKKVAAELGGTWSADSIAAYLKSNSEATAKKINQTTADEITAALEAQDDASPEDTIGGVFDGEVAARAGQISASRVAMVAGLASLVAARLSNAKTKTWVTGGNPRSTHAQMSGETVPLGELFSNGMDGPGDYSGGAAEVANCDCTLDFSVEG
ncbi:MAG: phage portal protein [Leifsonia sp.]